MFKSDPESLWSSGRHLKQPLCKLPITVERKEEIIFLFSLFFFREKKHIVQIKSSEDQKLPKKKQRKKDCILTGIMNEHKEIIQCGTNKILFTYSMYCQWPITHCLQKMSHSFDMIPA